MIEVLEYNAYRDGPRRCAHCFDVHSNDQVLTELILGTARVILCTSCLQQLQKKISDRLDICVAKSPFPEITLPKGSAEHVNKVIADAENCLKENG